jgi:hypothetical protein
MKNSDMEQEFERSKSKVQGYENEKEFLLDVDIITENSAVITEELSWLIRLLDNRIEVLNRTPGVEELFFSGIELPDLSGKHSSYAELVNKYKLNGSERLMLISALLPQVAPEVFTRRLRDEQRPLKVLHPELGGFFDATFTNFVPSLQTILFLLAGNDITNMVYYHLSLKQSVLIKEQIIGFKSVMNTEDENNERNHVIMMAPEFVRYILSGEKPRPDFGRAFPARMVTTDLTWEELVLDEITLECVNGIMKWVSASNKLNSVRKIRKGFPCLFFGPPGTGKTLTAQLIGRTFRKDVFRIDLSMIVSKYVGETEKNLALLFDRAVNKDCILFFDEADALFSRRTEVNSSNDKWANLEMAYLLQKMEEHPGLTILATNLRNNLDPAMTRRFQAMIHFPRPKKDDRKKLWKLALPDDFTYAPNISLEKLAKYELTGANISNVIKYCCVESLSRNEFTIMGQDLLKGIRRELAKENRTL